MEVKEAQAKTKRDMIDVYEAQLKEQFKRALAYSHLQDSQLFKDVRKDVRKLRKRKLGSGEAFNRALKCNKAFRYWMKRDTETNDDEESTDDENDF